MLCVSQNFLCCVSSDIRFSFTGEKHFEVKFTAFISAVFYSLQTSHSQEVFSFSQTVLQASIAMVSYMDCCLVNSVMLGEMGDSLRRNSVNLVSMVHVFHLMT